MKMLKILVAFVAGLGASEAISYTMEKLPISSPTTLSAAPAQDVGVVEMDKQLPLDIIKSPSDQNGASVYKNSGLMRSKWHDLSPPVQPPRWAFVSTLSSAAVWARAGQSQTFYLTPQIEKTYAATKSAHILSVGEIFMGLQRNRKNQPLGQIGLAVGMSNKAKLAGHIWDDADPQFDNYRYNYNINHSYALLKGKLMLDRDYWVLPWISAGFGVALNRSYGFNNTPTIVEALVNNNFTSKTKTTFTYTLGAGVQKAINLNWQLGLGYEFTDWGKSNLDRAQNQTLSSGLKLSHLQTNGLLFCLTYIV